jgi:hypothetical protein
MYPTDPPTPVDPRGTVASGRSADHSAYVAVLAAVALCRYPEDLPERLRAQGYQLEPIPQELPEQVEEYPHDLLRDAARAYLGAASGFRLKAVQAVLEHDGRYPATKVQSLRMLAVGRKLGIQDPWDDLTRQGGTL